MLDQDNETKQNQAEHKNTSLHYLLTFATIGILLIAVSFFILQFQGKSDRVAGEKARDTNTQAGIPDTSQSGVFLSAIPPDVFSHLTAADLPLGGKTSAHRPKAILFDNEVFSLSYPYIIKYDLEGNIVSYTDPKQIACGQDMEIIGRSLYIACFEKGVYEVNLDTNKITYVYTEKDGLKSLKNLQVHGNGNTLWVGTFEGVAKINRQTHQTIFYQEELGIPGTNFGSTVYGRGDNIWAVVTANDGSLGGATRYIETTDTWESYTPEDFKQRELHRIDFDFFIVSDEGVYALFQENDPYVFFLKRFDEETKKWKEVFRRAGLTGREEARLYLPAKETYTSFDTGENDTIAIRTLETIRVFYRGSWMSIPIMGRKALGVSALVDDTYYIMTDIGIDTLKKGDAFPTVLNVRSDVFQHMPSNDTLVSFVTEDKRYVIFAATLVSQMGGDTYAYTIGVYDIEKETVFGKYIPFISERESLEKPLPTLVLSLATVRYEGEGMIISEPEGEGVIVIDFAKQTIALEKSDR